MPPPTAKSPLCEAGKCLCIPACPVQLARVEGRLALFRDALRPVPSETAILALVQEPPKGHAWLCPACATIQPGPGAHCGYAILLVEKGDLEIDARTGRVTRATAVENPKLYRSAPPGSLDGKWKPHGT